MSKVDKYVQYSKLMNKIHLAVHLRENLTLSFNDLILLKNMLNDLEERYIDLEDDYRELRRKFIDLHETLDEIYKNIDYFRNK